MDAGRDLDSLIAEKVMRWKTWIADGTLDECWETGDEYNPTIRKSQWRPSTDISAAWEVVEKMIANGFDDVTLDYTDGWTAFFSDYDERAAKTRTLPSAPLAICIAALLAMGHEVK
jgi:Phage ABA sandwich domain